jgi:DNA-binding MarR family transcriptional regulator
MTERNPDGYSRVEHELAIPPRRAQANPGDLSREVRADLQVCGHALLGRLHDLGSARAADLSECFGIDKGVPSHQLKVLEKLQFITRETDTADHRSHRLTLTADGRRRLTRARRARRHLIRQEPLRWPTSDVKAVADLLARFNSSARDTR